MIAQPQRTARGWSIRIPLRREDVSIEKRTYVYEEVEVRRELVEDVEPTRRVIYARR